MYHTAIKILLHFFAFTSIHPSAIISTEDTRWFNDDCCPANIQNLFIRALELASMERNPKLDLKSMPDQLDQFDVPGEIDSEGMSMMERQNKKEKEGSNQIMSEYLKRQSATGGKEAPRMKRGEVSVRKLAEILHTLKTMEPNENGLPPLQSLRFG